MVNGFDQQCKYEDAVMTAQSPMGVIGIPKSGDKRIVVLTLSQCMWLVYRYFCVVSYVLMLLGALFLFSYRLLFSCCFLLVYFFLRWGIWISFKPPTLLRHIAGKILHSYI